MSRTTLRKDAVAGLVLGVESVPDGLASGVLAGVNPLAGLYGYLFGMVGAAFATSSAFMAVQATGAMALVVADADLASRPDPDRALYTLAMLTGVVMIVAGVLRLGTLVRFVPTAVMTGFITAIGVNIVLGQLGNFTGFDAQGANRLLKTVDLVAHLFQWSLPALAVGGVTLAVIMLLQPTRAGSLGLVIAVIAGSLAAWLLNLWIATPVSQIGDLVDVPRGLPAPVLPTIDDMLYLSIPATSLAFVGLVQGAGVSAGIPTPSGKPADASRDFIGQGVGNLVAGVFRGMPVGGSMSASALVVQAGARSRASLLIAGAVMAVVILLAADLVAFVAMPSLAALLIYVGLASIKPSRIYSVLRSSTLQAVVMATTFVLTVIIPLQFAVLVGVGLGVVLFVAQQSNRVRVRRLEFGGDGRLRESDPPPAVAAREIVILQPYGSLFFASAPILESQLPTVSRESEGAIVIIRLRGTDELGLAQVEVLRRYAHALRDANATLKLVVSEDRVVRQLEAGGLRGELGEEHLYRGTEWVTATLRRAYRDARR
ncbi:SulP family inorganic anion transporter, partial [Microbacterium sp.]|uniref:SulP family inorganic anion transporter n=1 Tax=Microbacterium sp. TaxID=51671 RepID=UPI003A83BE42